MVSPCGFAQPSDRRNDFHEQFPVKYPGCRDLPLPTPQDPYPVYVLNNNDHLRRHVLVNSCLSPLSGLLRSQQTSEINKLTLSLKTLCWLLPVSHNLSDFYTISSKCSFSYFVLPAQSFLFQRSLTIITHLLSPFI